MASLTTTGPVDATEVLVGGDGRSIPNSKDFASRLRRARLGMFVAVSAVGMIFISYSSAYFVRQGLPSLDPSSGALVHDWLPLPLPNFLLVNTLVLLLSTLTMELARRQVIREVAVASPDPVHPPTHSQTNDIPWLGMTAILGLAFLAGQWLVWRELAARGFYIATNPSNSFFYVLTGTHAVHLLGGIIALLAASAALLFFRKSATSRGVLVDATAWYWHFMTLLWVYLLCLMKFAH
jgi:cytochrome c oxidase subunit III